MHSAKFPNEKDKNNLYKAVQRYELRHPVVNDSEFQVWQQYARRAWPTLMFIDLQGKVIGKHEGELPYEAFDQVLADMVTQFDQHGLLNRSPIPFTRAPEPDQTLSIPGKLLADGPGNRLFIADTYKHLVRVADLETKQVSTLTISGL